jgi:hypothetical protein
VVGRKSDQVQRPGSNIISNVPQKVASLVLTSFIFCTMKGMLWRGAMSCGWITRFGVIHG